MNRTAIVIGAGIGGLTAAMKLAHQGWRVELHEKTGEPGGRCGRVQLEPVETEPTPDRFTFDLGPTILLMPFIFEQTFASVGRKLSDYVELRRCDPNYRVTFADDSTLTLSSELTAMRAELERLEPGCFERYLTFMSKGCDQHDTAMSLFVTKHFDSLLQFIKPSNLPHFFRIGAHRTLFDQVAKTFEDPRLQQAMSFQTMYLGVSPYEAPAVFSLLPYTEMAHGIWFPMGGMSSIARALETVCRELGVVFHYGSAVKRIRTERGRATGVTLGDGSERSADVVVCNADLAWACANLLSPSENPVPTIEAKRFTSSGYMLYLGLKRRIEGLEHHNMFFGRDFEGSFTDIFERLQVPQDPSFYVNAPTRTDPSMAPAGKDALYVLVPVPHRTPNIDWRSEGPKVRAKVMARLAALGFGDLEREIEVERVMTPDDWETQLNLARGSNFGLAQNLFQIGPFRPKVWHDKVENLFFCGASVQPGTGVPTVMISADLAVKAITRLVEGTPAQEEGRPTSTSQVLT